MRKLRIGLLVALCIITAFLCGIFAYGMSGHNIYWGFWGRDFDFAGMHLVLEKEVPLDGIDSISISYDMSSNDIYLHEGEGSTLTIREYNEAELKENELSTVTVKGSRLEIKGKGRNYRNYSAGFFRIGYGGGYTEIWLPASYKGELALATSSGDISSDMDIALEKDLKASTTSGDIGMQDIAAENVSLECSSGGIRIDNINTERNGTAGNISMATTSGDIAVKQLAGETRIGCSSGCVTADGIIGNAQIETTSGDITVQRIDGNAEVGASSGRVKIKEGSGGRSIRTTSGDVTLEGADSPWEIHTSSGEVWLKAQKGGGGIETTSGDVNLELVELTGALDIGCSSGYVNIKLSQDNAFTFSADTSSGDISTFFDDDLNFSKRGNNAQGTYGQNSQGNSIQIGTTSGDVKITKY